jgi:copper chaperone CopZ
VTHEDGAEVVVWDANGASRTFVYNGSPDKLCFNTHGSDFAEGAYLSPCCVDNSDLSEDNLNICNKRIKEENDKAQRYHNIQYDQTDGKEQLILEYDCTACGENGLQGKFPLVSKQTLDNDLHVHVFESEIDIKPFQWTECFRYMQTADIFDTTSQRFQNAIQRSPSPREGNKFPTRVIGVKECPKLNNGQCAGSFGQDVHVAAGVEDPPLLSPDFAKLVRSELDKCCEDEPFSTNRMDSHNSGDLAKAQKSCCSGKSCSASTKDKVEDGILIDDEKAKDEKKVDKVKKSCCSGKSCSASEKNETKEMDARFSMEKNKSTDFVKPSHKALSKRTEKEVGHSTSALKDDNPVYKKCCETFWWEKCSERTCSTKTASTVTDLDNESIDLPSSNDNTVRSVIKCSQICCAAEIPGINKVLDPLDGIAKVLINVPNKCVMVDHVPSLITAEDIVVILNKARFGASLKRDGGLASTSSVGRSQLFVEGICCASEIPAINRILVTLKGVSKVSINVQGKLVFVDHDTQVVSAQQLCDALNEKCFGACVRHDAVDDQTETLTTFVRSTISVIAGLPSTDVLKAFMSSYNGREIESFIADTAEKKIHIVHNPLVLPIDDIVASLEEHRGTLEVSVDIDGAKNIDWDFPPLEEEEDSREEVQSLPKPTVMLSGLFWILSMFSYIGGDWEYLKYVALASVVIGLPPIAVKAFARLRSFQFDTNVLMCSAVVGALALQEFAEAAAVTFLFSVSDWLERRATTRARNALSEIVRLRPSQATIFHPSTKELIVVPASSVPVGALVSAKAGAQIPCDGIVVGGKSVVDESSLTGESRPVKKGVKDKVSGGTINSGMKELLIRTTSSSENSAVSRLIRLVEEAQANRSETEKMVDEFAKRYTPLVIAGALLMVSIPWAWGRDVGRRWTETGLILRKLHI